MAREYTVRPSDTLAKIAKVFYGDALIARKLAEYNGIKNPDLIRVNQVIEIPSQRELLGGLRPTLTAPASGLTPPNGLPEILATFGDIYSLIRDDGSLDPRWETEYMAYTHLPFPIPLSWDLSKSVTKLYGHKKLTELLSNVFAEIERRALRTKVRTYGGCYNFRQKRTSRKLSTHSWGIAVDLNPDSNPQGSSGDMDPEVVEVFRQFGFKWGGDWSGRSKDPMHFKFCTGY